MLSELEEVLNKMTPGPSKQQQQRVPGTTDTSEEDPDAELPRR